MPIRVLSPEVASQIAAGEVVERPASVVKELLENALDAGAKTVSVEIAAAGRSLVRVSDDGSGIPPAELPLAVERHATSKLVSAQDLARITTLGFRGEALASIGSVSRLTVTSRTQGDSGGTRLQVEGGRIGKTQPVGAPLGTVVSVEDLFYNVPARLKFLKQDLTERRAIDALLSHYALAYPQVRFRLSEGTTVALETPGDGDRRAILASLYGVDAARQLLEVFSDEDGLRLTGFLSPGSLTRSNRREITFFINGRWVQDTPLTSALLQAYHTLLMVGRYPLAVIFLEVPPELVDVNVHPAKAEVRFRSPERIFGFVQRSARRALLANAPVPHLEPGATGSSDGAWLRQPDLSWSMLHEQGSLGGLASPASGRPDAQPGSAELPQSYGQVALPALRLVGQVGATYLVAEGPDGVYLVDQHAAHERVLFEKLMAQHGQQAIASQTLLTPVVVELPPASARLLRDQLPVLQHFGFDVEAFGPGAYRVRAMPALFSGAEPAAALRALVEDFEEDESPLRSELEARIAGRVCKRLAVKAGQVLNPAEQRSLLDDLEATVSPRTCPHGRPTMIHLPLDMLERQFGRRGAR